MCGGVCTYVQCGCEVFGVVHMLSVQDAVMCVCFLLLSSPSPSMVNGGMKKLLVQQSSARPLPINIYCQLLQELSHISPHCQIKMHW